MSAPAEGYVPEPHTAPHDEIVAVVRRLLRSTSAGAVSIDAVANALREEGFRRTPGSPRLITRLRRIKELSFGRSGMITLIDGGAPREAVSAPAPRETMSAPAPREEAPRVPARAAQSVEFSERAAEVEAAQRAAREEPMPGDVAGNRGEPDGNRAEPARAGASGPRGQQRRGGRRGRGRGRGPSRTPAPVAPQP